MSAFVNRFVRVGRLVGGGGPGSVRIMEGLSRQASTRHSLYEIPLVRICNVGASEFDWSKVYRTLLMGQSPAQLLKTHAGPSQGSGSRFVEAGSFVDNEKTRLKAALHAVDGIDVPGQILGVSKSADNEIAVRVRHLKDGVIYDFVAESAFFALGAGAERLIDVPRSLRNTGFKRSFAEESTGVKALTGATPMIHGAVVVIVGDGPTALWNAEHYRRNGNDVYVVGPNSSKAFANANPGGRNSATLQWLQTENRLITADIDGIEQSRLLQDYGDPSTCGQYLHLADARFLGSGSGSASKVLPCALIVSSIGTTNQVMGIFEPALVAALYPIIEAGAGGDAAIGFTTLNQDVTIFGAQAIAEASRRGQSDLFNRAGSRIGQPPPGILTTEASIRDILAHRVALGHDAVNRGMLAIGLSDFDPRSGSQREMGEFLQAQGVHAAAAKEIAAALIDCRSELLIKGIDFTSERMARLWQTIRAERKGGALAQQMREMATEHD